MFLPIKVFLSFLVLITTTFFSSSPSHQNMPSTTSNIRVELDEKKPNSDDNDLNITKTNSVELVPHSIEDVHKNVVKVKKVEEKQTVPSKVDVHSNENKVNKDIKATKPANNTPPTTNNAGRSNAQITTHQQEMYRAPVRSQMPTPRHDGFSFNGINYGIKNFSGVSVLPADEFVYRWTTLPSHFLIERTGRAGQNINQLHTNDNVYIQNKEYKIIAVKTGVPNNNNAFNVLREGYQQYNAQVSWQTCETSNYMSSLTIWYAR